MNDFVVRHYSARADDYVRSPTHVSGEDLGRLSLILSEIQSKVMLDLGCGGGHVSYRAAASAELVVAYDPTLSMCQAVGQEAAERNLEAILPVCGFAEELPFREGCFDAVLSRYSAHHWNDLKVGLSEARRVLRSGGMGIFIDTIAPEEPMSDSVLQAIESLRDPSHKRNYSIKEWVAAFEEAGFAVSACYPMRLSLEFSPWVSRTQTPDLHCRAILSLQNATDASVRHHFDMKQDGSFTLDTAFFVVS